jgi:DNA polymerase-1
MMAAYLQGGEAILMKLAVVLSVEEIQKRKLDARLVNVVHDEMLFDCHKDHAEEVRQITEWSICEAGKILKLKCPMKGMGNVGRNWLAVH